MTEYGSKTSQTLVVVNICQAAGTHDTDYGCCDHCGTWAADETAAVAAAKQARITR